MPKKKRDEKKSAAPVPVFGPIEPVAKSHRKEYRIYFACAAILISTCLLGFAVYLHKRAHSPQTRSSNAHVDLDEYVDPKSCAECHGEIAESFNHTGMSHSMSKPTTDNMREDFAARNTIYNKASGDYYTMIRRGDEYYQRRHQLGYDGKETNVLEERIDYVIGSGDLARSFLHRNSQGMLIELPVTWYTEKNGYWEMSPGYDFASQKDFHGRVSKDCIFCHDAYPSATSIEIEDSKEPIFPSALPLGIDCQRCHGPGGAHEKAARSSKTSESQVRSTIVNPAALNRDRQLEVCMECHLSTSGSQTANMSIRYNRAIFSYRPGQPLSDYKLYFDSSTKEDENHFGIADAAYRLRRSRCFKQSQMTCLSCHNPHLESHGKQAEATYIQICESCHQGVTHRMSLPKNQTCLTCYMPKRRGEYAVHVVLTDHYIQRQKPPGDLLRPQAPPVISAESTGQLAPYYPEKLGDHSDDQLYLEIAKCENAPNLPCANALETLVKRQAPTEAGFYAALGDAYARAGNPGQAVTWFDQALQKEPENRAIFGGMVDSLIASDQLNRARQMLESAVGKSPPNPTALANLGNVYARQGQLEKAQETLHSALSIDPELAQAYNLLGMIPERQEDDDAALRFYREAIRFRPDLAEAHNNLARVLAATKHYDEAAFELKQAIAAAPGFAEAHHSYGLLLAATKSDSQAEDQLEEAVHFAPDNADFHSDLADLLADRGKETRAISEYREALEIDPNLAEANVGLGMALVHQGDIIEGKAYCGVALRSSDQSLVDLAKACMRR